MGSHVAGILGTSLDCGFEVTFYIFSIVTCPPPEPWFPYAGQIISRIHVLGLVEKLANAACVQYTIQCLLTIFSLPFYLLFLKSPVHHISTVPSHKTKHR